MPEVEEMETAMENSPLNSPKPAPLDLEQFKGHTPSPWYAEQPWSGFSAIRGPSNELIFGLAAGVASEKQPDEVCEANAALIAAAPTLLARLKDAEEALEKNAQRFGAIMEAAENDDRDAAHELARRAQISTREYLARSHLQPEEGE